MDWKLIDKLPDGHRVFSTKVDGEIMYAIADDSGFTPEDTDDGVLWLDHKRCLIVDRDESYNPAREFIAIPLVDDKGKQTRTPSDMSSVLHLANLLKWQVEDFHIKAVYEIR